MKSLFNPFAPPKTLREKLLSRILEQQEHLISLELLSLEAQGRVDIARKQLDALKSHSAPG